jgi:hypothetical protein
MKNPLIFGCAGSGTPTSASAGKVDDDEGTRGDGSAS